MTSHEMQPTRTNRAELRETLYTLLADRERGLLTQAEYEERLGEAELLIGADQMLDQRDLRGGGTRLLLRCRLTGDVLDMIDYRPTWSPDV